ncbi:MAG: beta-galactosidase trimerization domain-containing protein [Clostridia bacterium]
MLASYVSDGGHLVITFRSGNRDLFNKINGLVLPGYFRELCGIDVINYDAAGTSIRPVSGITGRLNADTWCDIVNERDSTVLAEYTGGFYSGTPCITSNSFGKGKVYYIGINTDMASYSAIFDYISEKAGVQRTPLRPVPGVETVTRKSPGSEYIFVMNHNDTPAIVPLDRQYTDAISKDHLSDCLRLESFGVAVIY